MNNSYLSLGALLALVISFFGCSENSDLMVDKEYDREMNIVIDGEPYEVRENDSFLLLGGNSNCQSLYLNTTISKGDITYSVSFDFLKNGQLKEARLRNWSENEDNNEIELYMTQIFNPKLSMNISDFAYNPSSNAVSFEFDGILYREEDESLQDDKLLNGSITMNSLTDIECSIPFLQFIEYQSDEFSFFTTKASFRQYNLTGEQVHKFTSNEGYYLEIQIDGDLWNLPNGSTYDFDDNTLTNRIDLYVYEGPTIASQVPGDFDQYWTRLKTTGSFEIVDKIESNTDKSIIGKINMDVFYEDEFLFHIEDMIFNTGSFE